MSRSYRVFGLELSPYSVKVRSYFRWWYEADQASAAERIARANLPGADESAIAKMAAAVGERMVPRLSFVGSNAATRPLIEGSFAHAVERLETHLAARPFLFGGRPAFADFGLWGQIYNLSTDPTPGALLRARAPRTMAWIERMLTPEAKGDFEPWSALAPTLEPLLRDEVAGRFLPWSAANALALEAGEGEFTVDFSGQPFTQQVQKYHAKSLDALRKRYRALPERSDLDAILERTGCLAWLRGDEG